MNPVRLLRRLLALVVAFGTGLPVLAATGTASKPAVVRVGDKPQTVTVHSLARTLGLEPGWLEPGRRLALRSPGSALVFEADRREVLVNGRRVFMGEGAVAAGDSLAISAIDRDRLLLPILAPQTLDPRPPLRVIALDAGHGGRDTGARNDALKLLEKDFALDVAGRVRALLAAAGHTVVLTRTDDTFVPLPERAVRAAAAGADVFLSIHFNATASPDVSGIETYVLTPRFQRSTGSDERRPDDDVDAPGNRFDGWNAYLGYTVHRQLLADLGLADRGLKRARFAVLRDLACPGVLIEGGYLSNPAEARLIATPAYRDRLAASIAASVDVYNQTLARLEAVRAATAR